jgi:hypothetical protein
MLPSYFLDYELHSRRSFNKIYLSCFTIEITFQVQAFYYREPIWNLEEKFQGVIWKV